jgi:hypothetical protein
MNHTEVQLLPEHRTNLLKLATYLLSGNLKADFDMSEFQDKEQETALICHKTMFHTCGTIGCALGHGPYADIPKNMISWWEYSKDNFGCGMAYNYSLWSFLFNDAWSDIDNTPEGAGKRILYFLRHGLPENYRRQIYGDSTLCYLNETL